MLSYSHLSYIHLHRLVCLWCVWCVISLVTSLLQADVLVVTFFVTQEHGLLLQDSALKPAGLQALLALDAPYYYYTCKVRVIHLLEPWPF